MDEEASEALDVLTERVDNVSNRQDMQQREIDREKERLLRVERNIEVLKAQTGVYSVPRRHRQGATHFDQHKPC